MFFFLHYQETSQSSFPERMLAHTPIPRCQNVVEYTSIKEEPCSLAQEPPLELEEQQEQVVPPETCFFSTIEGIGTFFYHSDVI